MRAAIDIGLASEDQLLTLHALFSAALPLDTFSPELLREKLFVNRRPQDYRMQVVVATRGDRIVGALQSVTRPATRKAWLGLFAVDAAERRADLGRALFIHARRLWPPNITECEVLALPGNYFTPGLDPCYTTAVCFVERLGFTRFKDCVNLTAPLSAAFRTAEEERRLAAEGVTVRRAAADDSALLDTFFAENFGADWRFEAGLAFDQQPITLHLALRDGGLIGFSAHSTQNREWGFFGPMGTTPAARGLGIGRVLLWHCLNDLRAAGHTRVLIPWVGPIGFYHQWCGATVARVFWRYRMTLPSAAESAAPIKD